MILEPLILLREVQRSSVDTRNYFGWPSALINFTSLNRVQSVQLIDQNPCGWANIC